VLPVTANNDDGDDVAGTAIVSPPPLDRPGAIAS